MNEEKQSNIDALTDGDIDAIAEFLNGVVSGFREEFHKGLREQRERFLAFLMDIAIRGEVVSVTDVQELQRKFEEDIPKQEAPQAPKQPELLTTDDVATLLKVNRKTLWKWKQRNYLNPVKVGVKSMYLKEDVDKIMTTRSITVQTPY
jgi:hypothetical protein